MLVRWTRNQRRQNSNSDIIEETQGGIRTRDFISAVYRRSSPVGQEASGKDREKNLERVEMEEDTHRTETEKQKGHQDPSENRPDFAPRYHA